MDTRKSVSLQEAKEHLFELVEEVSRGVEVTITKRGKAVATISGSKLSDLKSAPAKQRRKLGALAQPGMKIDFKSWWRSWKAADKEMERAFLRSLDEPWDGNPKQATPPVPAKKLRKGRK